MSSSSIAFAVCEAEKWIQAAVALQPDSMESHHLLARLHLQQRRYDAALNEALKCQTEPPEALAVSILGISLTRNGDAAGAWRTLERLAEMSSAGYVDPVASAHVHVALKSARPDSLSKVSPSLSCRCAGPITSGPLPAIETRPRTKYTEPALVLITCLRTPDANGCKQGSN